MIVMRRYLGTVGFVLIVISISLFFISAASSKPSSTLVLNVNVL